MLIVYVSYLKNFLEFLELKNYFDEKAGMDIYKLLNV